MSQYMYVYNRNENECLLDGPDSIFCISVVCYADFAGLACSRTAAYGYYLHHEECDCFVHIVS